MQRFNSELLNLLHNHRLKNVTYNISPTHLIMIYRESRDKYHVTEIIGELDTCDMNNLKTPADFRRFRIFQQAKPKLTPAEIDYHSDQSILLELFPTNVHIHSGYNPGSRNMVYDITLSAYDYGPYVPEPPYTQIGDVEHVLETILKEIFKRENIFKILDRNEST